MIRVKQAFQGPTVENVPGAVRAALGRLELPVKAGQSVALTVGSRGVVNIDAIVRATVEHMKALGARPFIIPAMGSHGGGTAEGQRSVLEHYGVTEATMGCPVHATMDVVQVGEALGLPIWLDRYAAEADWIGVDQPGQASHGLHGGHRLRPPEDDDDRDGQAPRRRAGPPGEHPARLRADDHRARGRDAPQRPDRVRARRRRERVRRDGARRRRSCPASSRRASGSSSGRRAPGWRSFPSRRSIS